jgi:DNA polymerase III delta prime subunit
MRIPISIKYRPYYVSDFNMNERFLNIYNMLRNIDDLNILFVGGENSGKTSLLYATIRDYYNLTRDDALPNAEIMFINNLKEQGINYFRSELMTFCKSKCSIHGKKKLVIFDDMDSINEHSQQVFRNYIDKYKSNINFIGVCSNIQKIIETLQSRLHIMKIHSLDKSQIRDIMYRIVKEEKIYIDDESIEYILGVSDDNIRNVINNIEKIYICGSSPKKPINIESCKLICSNISYRKLDVFLTHIKDKHLEHAINVLYSIHDDGYSVIDILDYFFNFLKITNNLDEKLKYLIIPIICKYITIFNTIHENKIELALFARDIILLMK